MDGMPMFCRKSKKKTRAEALFFIIMILGLITFYGPRARLLMLRLEEQLITRGNAEYVTVRGSLKSMKREKHGIDSDIVSFVGHRWVVKFESIIDDSTVVKSDQIVNFNLIATLEETKEPYVEYMYYYFPEKAGSISSISVKELSVYVSDSYIAMLREGE